jgi:glycosyltransferase involved in cell wall biosynthesis
MLNSHENKTIWVLNYFAGTPLSGWGERHFYFAKYWKKKGYKVIIFSSSFNHMFSNIPTVKKKFTREIYEGIEFVWVKTPVYNPKSIMRFWSQMVFAWRVRNLSSSVFGIPDTIIVSSMPIFSIWSGVLLKKIYNSKLLFEIRDIWPLTLQLLGNKSAKHPAVKFIGWFEKMGYRNSDVIVSLLPNAENHFTEVAGKKIKFSYIPNGIDGSQLKNDNISDDLKSKLPKDKFIIGYAGTIGLANALEYLIDAAEIYRNDDRFHFVIVGDGYLKQRLFNKSKNWGNVSFFDKIKKNKVQNLLKYFDVCFVGRNDTPLFKHGVSANKYFDYMFAGKPILDSNNYIKDPVELSGCGIIVKPDSAQAIANGIELFYNMTAENRHKIGQLGQKYVLENHNIEFLANKYSKLFSS